MAQVNTGTGNTPSGNAGAGTTETTSAPDPVVSGGTATTGPVTGDGVQGTQGVNVELTDADFKKDGDLRKDAIRRIKDNAPARSGERSFNEVTGETTVTTVVGGQTVTFTEDGDTRGEPRARATDSAIEAMDNADEEKE